MAIYTSYFGNTKNFPKGSCLISIASYSPIQVDYDLKNYCAPNKQLLKLYKEKSINEEEYTRYYYHQMIPTLDSYKIRYLALFLQDLSKYYENVFLLCYERPEEFCHRHLLADLLHMNIEEYPIYKGSDNSGTDS